MDPSGLASTLHHPYVSYVNIRLLLLVLLKIQRNQITPPTGLERIDRILTLDTLFIEGVHDVLSLYVFYRLTHLVGS